MSSGKVKDKTSLQVKNFLFLFFVIKRNASSQQTLKLADKLFKIKLLFTSILAYFLERIHAQIYILLSLFGLICSSLLIIGSLRKSSGKIIWWIVFQGISIFHQVYFSIDVLLILYHELHPKHLIEILVIMSIAFLCYIFLEIYFMIFTVELYQAITECEIEQDSRVSRISSVSSTVPVRQTRDILRDLTDRNNPMQSSIIKLLYELEGNEPSSDAAPLINTL